MWTIHRHVWSPPIPTTPTYTRSHPGRDPENGAPPVAPGGSLCRLRHHPTRPPSQGAIKRAASNFSYLFNIEEGMGIAATKPHSQCKYWAWRGICSYTATEPVARLQPISCGDCGTPAIREISQKGRSRPIPRRASKSGCPRRLGSGVGTWGENASFRVGVL